MLVREGNKGRLTETQCAERSRVSPCEPGTNPCINELKIKQRAGGGKM